MVSGPIVSACMHSRSRGARGAAAAAWSLTVVLAGCGGDPAAESPAAPPSPPPIFHEVAAQLGIDFRHEVTADGRYRIAEVVGSGLAVLDADGDGRLDLLFASAGDGPENGAANRLYVQGPDGTFHDATAASGLGGHGFSTGLAVGDVDNDGDPDVFVGNWGEDALYVNVGGGRFERRAAEIGIGGPADGLTTSVAFLDYDRDGFLDVYVTRYVVPLALASCDGADTPKTEYCAPDAYPPAQDALYHNRGDGTFDDVSASSGIARRPGPGLAVTIEDIDGDGLPDIYVGNDGRANFAWINRGDGTFHDAAVALGLAFNGMGAAEATMGIAVGDVNGDGRRELALAHLSGETNTLYRRVGTSGYTDASGRSGVAAASVPHTGWGIVLFDLELDGDLDMAVTNGAVGRRERLWAKPGPTPWVRYAEPFQLLRGDGSGKLLEVRGAFGDMRAVGRGLVAVDIDGDGDLDLVANRIAGPAVVFRNDARREGAWLRVRCIDPALRRDAYGARVRVAAGGREFVRVISPASSYASSNDVTAHFGLGAVTAVERIDVTWPAGDTERFAVDGVDRAVVLRRGEGAR